MNILVVTGSVSTSIDSVRKITNTATGRTGKLIAETAAMRGHHGVLLTSTLPSTSIFNWKFVHFIEFFELLEKIQYLLVNFNFDAIVMAAAICDYLVANISLEKNQVHQINQDKISGHLPELWIRLIPAPRLTELIRSSWGFNGQLITFKLESSISTQELISRAEKSRIRSGSNFVVANLLETADVEAWFGPNLKGIYNRLERQNLPSILLDAIEFGVIN